MKATKLRENFDFIQALRGVAAMWVVLFHAMKAEHIPQLYNALPSWFSAILFDAGHLGVAIFFTLSGFVIAHSLAGKQMNPRNYGRFMLRRSVRLDPTYWVAILFTIAVGFCAAIVQGEAWSMPGLGAIAAHIFYMQLYLGIENIDVVYWTLAYEVQFYAFFAAAMMVRRSEIAMFLMALLSAFGAFNDLVGGLFLSLWGSFFVGVTARYAVADKRWIAGLGLLALALAWSGEFGFVNGVTAFFLWAGVVSGWGVNGLSWKWLQHLGAVSYSLYLFHNPVTVGASFFARRVLPGGLAGDVLKLAIIIVACIAAAHIVWLLVERPSHRLSRRIEYSRESTQPSVSGPQPV
ncbi:MAG: acyltransferase [Parvularcula sp.]|nr:acyltransferase [Parvularcula sp.]